MRHVAAWWRRGYRLRRGPAAALGLRPIQAAAFAAVALYLVALSAAWLGLAATGDLGLYEVRPDPAAPERAQVRDVIRHGALDRAGIRNGDYLLAVDGTPASDLHEFLRAATGARGGEVALYRVQRAGTRPDGPVEIVAVGLNSRVAHGEAVFRLLVYTVVGTLSLAVGLVASQSRSPEPAARLLLVSGGSFALAMALVGVLEGVFQQWLQGLFVIFFGVTCAALLHIFLVFPAPLPAFWRARRWGPRALRLLGGPAVVGLYLVPILAGLATWLTPPALWSWAYLMYGLMMLATLAALLRSYRHPATPLARAQLKWILAGLLIGVASFFLAIVVPVLTNGEVRPVPIIVAVAAQAFFPLAIGVAVLRYRLFEVNRLLRASLIYSLLLALLVAGYFLVAFGVNRAVTSVAGMDGAATVLAEVVAALAVAVFAYPARLGVQRLLDHLVYRDRLARQRFVRQAAVALGHAQPPSEVRRFLTATAKYQLDLSGAWLVLPPGMADDASSAADLPAAPEALLERLAEVRRPVLLVHPASQRATSLPRILANDDVLGPWYAAGVRLLVPLRSGGATRAAFGNREVGAGEDLIGVWALGPRRSGELYEREDLQAVVQVGQQAAVLIDYARLTREQLRQEVVRHELARAREIQNRLLPDRLDGWPGRLELAARFESCHETSGDFYDVFPLAAPSAPGEPVPLQIAVGDVAGKSIPAAMVMAVARTTLRTAALCAGSPLVAPTVVGAGACPPLGDACSVQSSPAATLRFTGALLHEDVGQRDFVCCALGVVSPETLHQGPTLALANAAQVPPLLCRDGVATELLPAGERLPLGILAAPAYGELTAELRPGDVVVFATDGLPEAPARPASALQGRSGWLAPPWLPAAIAPGELFGFERLALSAARWAANEYSAEAVAAGIWADVRAWCGNDSHHDDMTLLVLRVPR